METTKNNKRWLILAVCCLINLCVGSMYAWSVFAMPMEAHLNEIDPVPLAAGAMSLVFTLSNAVGPVTMILGGKINDSIGPKMVLIVGGVMFGAGQIIAGFSTSLGMLMFGYGILCGLGAAMVYSCNVSTWVK